MSRVGLVSGMNTMTRNLLPTFAVVAFAVCVAGCNLTGATDPPPAFPAGSVQGAGAKPYTPDSLAGLPVTPDPDPSKLAKLVVARANSFGTARSDPFALTPEERAFETKQQTERFFAGPSSFSVQLTPKAVVEDEAIPAEPQPYRRLSGIVVGDSILAILEEEGREPVIVTPGMRIPNSEWRVVSINQDKAVLSRPGKVKPNQIEVRLETARFGTQPAYGGNQGGRPGGEGGYPGGPGGYPGGPGGYPGGRGGFPGGPGGYPGGPGGRP